MFNRVHATYAKISLYRHFGWTMCGIIATLEINSADYLVAIDMHDALHLLRHRGHDACGPLLVLLAAKSTNTSERMCSKGFAMAQ